MTDEYEMVARWEGEGGSCITHEPVITCRTCGTVCGPMIQESNEWVGLKHKARLGDTHNPSRIACSECAAVVPWQQHDASCYFHPDNVRRMVDSYSSLHKGRRS